MLVCRDKNKAEQATKEIIDLTGNFRVRFELADLSRYGDILRLVERWTGPLHGLINNAACTPRTRQETPEGIPYSPRVISLQYDDFPSQVFHAIEETTIYRCHQSESFFLKDFFFDGHLLRRDCLKMEVIRCGGTASGSVVEHSPAGTKISDELEKGIDLFRDDLGAMV